MTFRPVTIAFVLLALFTLTGAAVAQPLGYVRAADQHGDAWRLEGVSVEGFLTSYSPDDNDAGQPGSGAGFAGTYEITFGSGPLALNLGIQLGIGVLSIDEDESVWGGELFIVHMVAPVRLMMFLDEMFAVYLGFGLGTEYFTDRAEYDNGVETIDVEIQATYLVMRGMLGARAYINGVGLYFEIVPAYHIGVDLEYTADNITYTAPDPTNLGLFGLRFGVVFQV